jgi:SulP family sulfate permease
MKKLLELIFPVMTWGPRYSLGRFRSDLVAGSVVLFITVPQVIAYAFLAGMPAEAGLYASMMSLVGYAVFGSSRALAVGPTAIVGIMTLEVASSFAIPETIDYTETVVQLCVVTGIVLIVLRVVNFGSVISFLSHAVVTGFITAAAILIISSQFPLMIGLASSPDTSIVGVYRYLFEEAGQFNQAVLSVSLIAVAVLIFCRSYLGSLLKKAGLADAVIDSLVKSAPMYAVVIGVVSVRLFSLDTVFEVPVVGHIPTVLPEINIVLMSLERFQVLFPSALLLSMVIFMESASIGTAIASKAREKINPNQELVGLGVANLGSSLVGGFPVAGSFSRSIINFSSGSVSPVASLVTAFLVMITILLFGTLFFHLPKGVLSAIIVISAWQLIDFQAVRKIFGFNTTDAVTFTFTFLAVLSLGVESGVLMGIAISFVLLIRSSSKPHIAVVGRVGDSEHFRNIERYDARTSPNLLALRVDESFYFVNTRFIETFILNDVADRRELEHVLLICTATNFIDTSGLVMLEELSENLAEVGVTLHMAEVKGPVMDKLKGTDFYRNMSGRIFFTADIAMKELTGV